MKQSPSTDSTDADPGAAEERLDKAPIPVLQSHVFLALQRLEDHRRAPDESHPAFEVIDRLRAAARR